MTPRPDRIGRFVWSLLALLTVVVAVPVGLVLTSRSRFGSANPLAGVDAPWRWFDDNAQLTGPVADDTVVDGLLRLSLVVIWVGVAVIAATTVMEVFHQLRHRGLPTPHVRGVGWAQPFARYVAAGLIALLPTASSTASIVGALPSDLRPSSSVLVDDTVEPAPPSMPRAAPAATATMAGDPVTAAPTDHVVRPGESVYSIAERLAAGTTSSTIEVADAILDLNLGATMATGERFTNPAYIQVGWTLRIPAGYADAGPASPAAAVEIIRVDAAERSPTATDYEVRVGDTLWDIAESQLGDASQWTELWRLNADRDMGGGRTFDDPNLILPGWILRLGDDVPVVEPTRPTAPEEAPESQVEVEPEPDVEPEPEPESQIEVEPEVAPADAPAPDPVPIFDLSEPIVTPTTVVASSTTAVTTTSTTEPVAGSPAGDTDGDPIDDGAPAAPSPVRLEHAALLAAGILALVGVRRRQRLRAARARHRVPEPRPEVVETERRLRTIDAGERALRVDVALRAAAFGLIDTDRQIVLVEVSPEGDVELVLTGDAVLPAPWTGERERWHLGAEIPIELLSEDARRVDLPCIAFVQVGVTTGGNDVLVDVEACGVLMVEATAKQADEVVAAIAAGLASSQHAEVAHLIGVSLPSAALLGHRNAHVVASSDEALELAASLVGTTAGNERTTFALRALRTGGEMWEPAIVLLTTSDDAVGPLGTLPAPGHGIGVVASGGPGDVPDAPTRIVAQRDGWCLHAFGTEIDFVPVGLTARDVSDIHDVLLDAERALEPMELAATDELAWIDDASGPTSERAEPEFVPTPHEIVVRLLGSVEVVDADGTPGRFERSKTVELIAWLATHRDRSTRTGARTALWEMDVRDATFANVVSEARRALARLVAPPLGQEWVARTLTEQLPIHDGVVTDAQLVEERVAEARLRPPSSAMEVLRPAVAMVREMPFAGTSYLWPDAEGITSNLVLLAMTVTTEFAGHALSLGAIDDVFWATAQGLRVLPGHEELIGLRMRAHAHAGDLAGVRQEWESYERVLVADAWSDGEPAPKLLALRRELLNT